MDCDRLPAKPPVRPSSRALNKRAATPLLCLHSHVIRRDAEAGEAGLVRNLAKPNVNASARPAEKAFGGCLPQSAYKPLTPLRATLSPAQYFTTGGGGGRMTEERYLRDPKGLAVRKTAASLCLLCRCHRSPSAWRGWTKQEGCQAGGRPSRSFNRPRSLPQGSERKDRQGSAGLQGSSANREDALWAGRGGGDLLIAEEGVAFSARLAGPGAFFHRRAATPSQA